MPCASLLVRIVQAACHPNGRPKQVREQFLFDGMAYCHFCFIHLGLVYTTSEEFKNGGFTLKTHQMFSVHTTPKAFKNATIAGRFEFAFEKTSGRKITWLSWGRRFQKAPFWKCFLSTQKRKASVFKLLRFEERFGNAPFLWRISVDGRPNRRNKATFSNSSGVVLTGLYMRHFSNNRRISDICIVAC